MTRLFCLEKNALFGGVDIQKYLEVQDTVGNWLYVGL